MRIFKWNGIGCYDYMAICDDNDFNYIIGHFNLDSDKCAEVSKCGWNDFCILLNSEEKIFSFPPFLALVFGGQYNDEPPYSEEETSIPCFDFFEYLYVAYPFVEPKDKLSMLYTTLDYLKNKKHEYQEAIVYLPSDVDEICEKSEHSIPISFGKRCGYGVHNADSFTIAYQLSQYRHLFDKNNGQDKVLVLNFANPLNPGGGVWEGAKAQEEDLCRRSSLLFSLESDVAKKYYEYNKNLHTNLGSDSIIISPNVEIIKDEDGKLLKNSFNVAVMTCAAPMVKYGLEGLSNEQYESLLYNRIVKMLKVSAYLKYKVLVLGAWGCGAFGNDAALVSDLFYKALKELEYNGVKENLLFNRIDFAVLSRGKEQYNYNQFNRNFSDFYRGEDQMQIDKAIENIKKTEVNLDKIRGCLVGGAVGDALGYPVEFLHEGEIFKKFGNDGIKDYSLDTFSGKALISDDTQMTLFTANGILVRDTREAMRGVSHNPRNFVKRAYLDWLITQETSFEDGHLYTDRQSWLLDVPELFNCRAPGNTCLATLKKLQNNKEYIEKYTSQHFNSSKGCGGVMRVSPLALRYPNVQIEELDKEGAELAAITHSHTLGYMPAAMLTHIIHRCVFDKTNVSLKEIVTDALDTISRIYKSNNNSLKILQRIIKLAVELSENNDNDLSNIHQLGEGWVAEETLAIAIYCSLKYQNDFSKGIIAAVNHNGDSDSTGSVTGNVLGAWLGFDNIEEKWKKNLELYDVLIEMADDLCHGCQMDEYSHYYDKAWANKYMNMHWHKAQLAKGTSTEITILKGDITRITDVEAVVNAANNSLLGGGGVDGAIHRAAGKELLEECKSLGGCETGKAKITKAYNLPCKYIIHTVGPKWRGGKYNENKFLKQCYLTSLNLAKENGIKTIAFPSISTGAFHYPIEEAVSIAISAIDEYVSKNPGVINRIVFVLFDDKTYNIYKEMLDKRQASKIINSPMLDQINFMLRNGLI